MKKLIGILLFIFLIAVFLSACGGGGGGVGGTGPSAPTLINLSNFQAASVVIGQPTFTAGMQNQGNGLAPGANTLSILYGNPLVHNGVLYLPDYGNNRVLGFNTVPTVNDASADFVLGQPDMISALSGSAANQMSGPQTVKSYNGKFFVDEYENSRVLIWNSAPTTTQAPAKIVVGQTRFGSVVTACTRTGLTNPESIEVVAGKLIVADSNNNRVLIWNRIPATNGVPADVVLGQNSFTTCVSNDDDQDGAIDGPTDRTLYYPAGVWSNGKRLIVADTKNNRVLIWNSIPTANFTPADVVLGQGDFTHMDYNDDNQDGVPDANPTSRTLDYPYFLDSNGTQLFVADCSNHRVLIWNSIPIANFTPADVVLGQGDFTHNQANDDDQDGVANYLSPTARTLFSPTGLLVYGKKLFVADRDNTRYLIFESQ